MQELHGDVRHLLALVFQHQPAGGHELADDRSLDTFGRAERDQFIDILRRHADYHPLLGLGDPDLGIGKAGVFQRHAVQPDLGPDLLAHLAHGAGKTAGAAVGHRRVQPSIAGGQEHVQDHLLRDGVADLHRAAGNGLALAVQFGGAERGAVDAIAAGTSADGHDHVAGPGFLERHAAGNQPQVSAEDQRIAQVAGIEIDSPIDRGNAHTVAVVAHARDDTLGHAPRMEHAGRYLVQWRVGRGEAEDVRIADRLGAHAGAHRVADHAADARIGPAVGLQGRRVIVRFHLENHVVLVVEPDHARVVAEDAYAPIVETQLFADFLRGGENRLLEHVLEAALARSVAVADPPRQRLVAAMLAPGLGDSLQLGVGRIAVELLKIGLDGLHFHQRQIELSLAAQDLQGLVVHRADRHALQAKDVGSAQFQVAETQGADNHLLDGIVGQDLRAERRCARGQCPRSSISSACGPPRPSARNLPSLTSRSGPRGP